MSFSLRSDVAVETDELDRALAARRLTRGEVLDLTVVTPDWIPDARASVGVPTPAALTAEQRGWAVPYAGRREALRSALRLLCDPGDEVLAPELAPPWLAAVAHAEDVGLVAYPLAGDARGSIDAATIYDAITPRTRAVLVMSPSVPFGAYPSADELEAMASFGLPLIADETDFDLVLEAPRERVSALSIRADALVVALRASLAPPGMPQAWAHLGGPQPLAAEATERLAAMRAALDGPISLEGLGPRRGPIQSTRAARNLAALRAALGDRVPRVEGGVHAPIAMPRTATDLEWTRRALERGVLVHPGSRFDLDERDAWLIVGLLTPPEVFDAGVAVLARL